MKFYFLFFFSFIISGGLYSQKLTLTKIFHYKQTAQIDSLDAASKVTLEYQVIFGDIGSIYNGYSFTDQNQLRTQMFVMNRESPSNIFNGFKDRKGNAINFKKFFYSGWVRWEDNKANMKWRLHDSIKKIGSYVCKKSTCDFRGRKWTAWYSEELPFSDGPYKFYGLPGLIVKLYDHRNHFLFELDKVEDIQPPIVVKDLKEVITSHELISTLDYLELVEDNDYSAMKKNSDMASFQVLDEAGEVDKAYTEKLNTEFKSQFKPIKLKNLIELTDENGKRIVLK